MFVRGRDACLAFALLALVAAPLAAQQHVAPTEPLSPEEEQKQFHLPPGFEIQLVAAEPAIQKPMNLKFDAKGRLFVTHSIEYPFAAKENPRDALTMLEDKDGDGHFETATKYVDGLNIPIGHHPTRDGALVYSIPNLYRTRDKDGDGKIDDREVLFGPFGTDDTHGMNNAFTRWLDDWYYACHGFRNDSKVKGKDGKELHLNSGSTYRFKADGSSIERYTWGQVNPFGLCFDPRGNLYTADCHSMPAYQVLRNAYYPSFGKPNDGLGEGPRLIDHNHDSTALCGIVYYAANNFPAEYRDTLFIGNVWTCRLNHNRITAKGSYLRGEKLPDFLTCDDPWFRPVDIQLGPDGALYIADFYNKIIGHYEVSLTHPGRDRHRGRIWRVVYRGTKEKPVANPQRPDFTKASLDELWQQLASDNLTVRVFATHEIVDRFGTAAGGILAKKAFVDETVATQRAHAAWIFERTGGLNKAQIEQLAADKEPLVRLHLMQALAERKEWSGETAFIAELVRAKLTDGDAFVRRAAADALGRHGSKDHVAALLAAWNTAEKEDLALIHVIRMSLRDQLLGQDGYAEARRIIAESKNEKQTIDHFLEVSLGAKTPESARFVAENLGIRRGADVRSLELAAHAVRYAAADQLTTVAELMLPKADDQVVASAARLRATQKAFQERGAALPAVVRESAVKLAITLLGQEPGHQTQGALLAKDLKLGEVYEPLAALAQLRSADEATRQTALETCSAERFEATLPLLDRLLADPAEASKVRQKAAQLLADSNRDDARTVLLSRLTQVHASLANDIATSLARTRPAAESLLAAMEGGKVSRQLLLEKTVVEGLRNARPDKLEERLAKLTEGLPPADAAIRELISKRRGLYTSTAAEATAGKAIFAKNCASCHRIGTEGNKIGPELNGIGSRGLDRVLEDILDPNRNVDPAFRTTTVQTTDGRVVTGLQLREEGQVLVLADKDGKEVRLMLDQVEARKISPLSAMPQNVAQQLPESDFAALVAYLLSLKTKGP